VVIIGDDEIAKSVVTLRDMLQGSQSEVPLDRIVDALSGSGRLGAGSGHGS
jgi:histidyl-tRNA synthetase